MKLQSTLPPVVQWVATRAAQPSHETTPVEFIAQTSRVSWPRGRHETLPPQARRPSQDALRLRVGELRGRNDAARLGTILDQAIAWARLAPLSSLDAEQLAVFTRQLPKVDLHCHLEGAISPEQLVAIARRHGIELPADNVEGLRPFIQVGPNDRTLLDFLSKFDTIGKVFTNAEVIEEITSGVIADAAADNVAHLELRFSPLYMAQAYNLDLDEVIQGVMRGVEQASKAHGTSVRLIFIVERQMGVEPAETVARLAAKYRDRGVVALDLANDEFHYPPGPYAAVFQQAKRAGLSITVHAGEAGGADNVAVSVRELGADRIGHGVRTREDAETLAMVRDQGVTLELCPTSNVQTGAVDQMAHHPLRDYFDAGVQVAVNTDDPAISDITLSEELQTVASQFGFSVAELRQLTDNGVAATFLGAADKQALQARIAERFAAAEQTLFEKLSLGQLRELAIAGIKAKSMPAATEQQTLVRLERQLAVLIAAESSALERAAAQSPSVSA